MFDTTVPYRTVVAAARDTAEKICAQGSRTVQVNVTTQGGETASVSWNPRQATLNLPTMPADTILSRAEANQIVGLIAHECCHVMHSDWSAWMIAVRMGDAIKTLTNAIEDVRIEAAEIRRRNLPGLRDALSDTCVLMHGKSLAAAAAQGHKIGELANHAGYVIAMLGRLRNKYHVPNAATLERDIDPRWRPAINHALQNLPRLRNTDGSRYLALQVFRMLQAAAPQEPEAGQDASGEAPEGAGSQEAPSEAPEGQDGQNAPGEAPEGQDGQDAPGEAPEGQNGQEAPGEAPEGQDGQEAPGEAPEGQDGQEAPGEAPEGQDGQEAPGEARKVSTGRDAAPPDLDGPWLDTSPSVDDIAKQHDATDDNARRSQLNGFREAVLSDVSPSRSHNTSPRDRIPRPAILADSVSRLVLSESRNSRERYLAAGRFDRRAVGRASWGAPNVFARKVYAEGIETAVFLLIDGSSSMEGAGIDDAKSLAYHLGQAIDAAGAQCAIGAFYTWALSRGYSDPAGFRIALQLAKHWDEPTDLAKLASIAVGGTTPLSPAIVAAAEMLAERHDAQRRILLVLTDGGCDLGADAVRDACGLAACLGVEVGGIGIGGGTDCRDTFPLGVDLGTGANLSEAALGVLVDMLERERA